MLASNIQSGVLRIVNRGFARIETASPLSSYFSKSQILHYPKSRTIFSRLPSNQASQNFSMLDATSKSFEKIAIANVDKKAAIHNLCGSTQAPADSTLKKVAWLALNAGTFIRPGTLDNSVFKYVDDINYPIRIHHAKGLEIALGKNPNKEIPLRHNMNNFLQFLIGLPPNHAIRLAHYAKGYLTDSSNVESVEYIAFFSDLVIKLKDIDGTTEEQKVIKELFLDIQKKIN